MLTRNSRPPSQLSSGRCAALQGESGEQQRAQQVEGDAQKVEGGRVVAAGQKIEKLDGFGDWAAGCLGFVGREEVGPVCGDALVITKGLGVVGIEAECQHIGEEYPGQGGQ